MRKLSDIQITAEAQLQGGLASRLQSVLGKSPSPDWLPDTPVKTASGHTQQILDLQNFLQASRTIAASHDSPLSFQIRLTQQPFT